MSIKGKIHSIQSLAALDGPGVRFAIFLQGCNLRCGCCHNPDTHSLSGGTEYTAEELIKKAVRYKEYFGYEGGITVSGGEPLLQAEFVTELFTLAKAEGINTCLDTSGSIINDKITALLSVSDRVMLDIKYTSDEKYRKYVGCSLHTPLSFLKILNRMRIPTTLRQVIIPTLNDTEENVLALGAYAIAHSCVDKIELLPFKKLCSVKYDKMGIQFPFADFPEPTAEKMAELENLIKNAKCSRSQA